METPPKRDWATIAGTIFGLILACGITAMGAYLLWPVIRRLFGG